MQVPGAYVGMSVCACGSQADHHGSSFYVLGLFTFVLICFTCPAITVATVILRALDRVRGRALGWLGPGSPKSQPRQAQRGVAVGVCRFNNRFIYY